MALNLAKAVAQVLSGSSLNWSWHGLTSRRIRNGSLAIPGDATIPWVPRSGVGKCVFALAAAAFHWVRVSPANSCPMARSYGELQLSAL